MEFFTASMASITANVFTHPLETIKVRQMVNGESSMTILVQMVKQEGPSSLYKGFSAAVIRAVISGGGRLYGYSYLKRKAQESNYISTEAKASDLTKLRLIAVFSSCLAQFLASPVDLIRTRQTANKTTSRPNIFTVAKDVIKVDGMLGLFSGSTALLFRAASFNVGQLLTYDKCKTELIRYTQLSSNNLYIHMFSSLGAGFIATTLSCPAENVKTFSQIHGKTTISKALIKLYQLDGFKTYFRGWTPLYLKIAPHTMIVFVTLEKLNEIFNKS